MTSWHRGSPAVLESTSRLVAEDNSETVVMPTDLSTTNETPRTNETLQRNLLHDDKRKFANLRDHFQLIKLCSNAGIVKTAAAGQYFMTFDDAELEKLERVRGGGRGEGVHVESTLFHRDNSTEDTRTNRMEMGSSR